MRIVIDTDTGQMIVGEGQPDEVTHPLYEEKALEVLSHYWLKAGWNCKYSYDFHWCGRRIIQMPEDMVRLQELIWETRPNVIVECGIAHGGSTVFFASMLQLIGGGKVVAVDIEIRPHNREGIEAHPYFDQITMFEGSSIDEGIVAKVKDCISPDDRVMVFLDSNHTREHVLRELELYAPMTTSGCYCVVADGVMTLLTDVPRGKPEWKDDNPLTAAADYFTDNDSFEADPAYTRTGVTYMQGGYFRRL